MFSLIEQLERCTGADYEGIREDARKTIRREKIPDRIKSFVSRKRKSFTTTDIALYMGVTQADVGKVMRVLEKEGQFKIVGVQKIGTGKSLVWQKVA